MVDRRIPKVRDLAPLMQFKKPEFNARTRRLAAATSIADLRTIAKRVTPKAPFDYTDGAAEGEISLTRARQAFQDIEFHPSVLRDVSHVDTTREVLGKTSALPFGIAPTGFTRMMQTEGERAGATAAEAAGIPFTLSTMGTTSIEDVAAAAPGGRNWFQLYMWTDRDRSLALVDRAQAAGYDTLMVTVDTPVGGARLRDVKNGFSIPPALTPKTVINALPRPAWWINFLTTEPLAFASLDRWSGTVAALIDTMFDPTVGPDEVRFIREQWKGKLVVKGIQSVADARLAVELGADAIVLSNHGGRQLDRAPIPFHLLPAVVREVGNEVEVHLDTGIMNGADIVASVAMGAQFTLIGRAYLYGLMAGGRQGVDRTIAILSEEITRTMKLLGVASLDELEPRHVTQLARLVPYASPAADAVASVNN
ncbi:alpha-hydroxy acid oxidase [Mycetocola zhujimingii]|uniref:Alpha-hydroxy-acid oxidizing protein n=1 Tax=Mycetocola zhujimingii TaxID=2079792 RepID=A0A2U1TD88_9MICO|nr:alpha-hydroxy acid oxidase [Mycetocola zhujimingii]AWB85317.1 alpha-hydroxy-acid oxidizing enzyme [Mycetocola zhujimingii]PWC06867.1 alpha-hydroxy-acid oxidizing protein [Mycetocola zhujimingii]